MDSFFAFLGTLATCGTIFFVVMLVLLALPKSKLRSVGLEMAKYGLAVGCLLLTVSPVDLVPDVIPIAGWADDLGYIVGGIAAIRSARGERRKRAFEEECEAAYMAKMAGIEPKTEREEEIQQLLEEQEQTNGRG